MDLITDLSPLSPGLIDELEAFMAPVGEGCYPPPPLDARRIGGHQLPESPPDSGSENPYSPETQVSHTIAVSQTVLGADYMLVPEHINHEILHNDYIYEELKDDEALRTDLNDVVVLPQDNMDLGLRTVRHDLAIDQYRYPELDQGMLNPQLVTLDQEPLTPVYTSLQEPSGKKRKLTESSQVKCEPAALSPEISARPPPSVDGSEAGDDSPLQCIRFVLFQQNTWHALYDCNLKILPPPSYIVGADKGFNFSQIDEAFVCQKKNHFQVTCQIQLQGEAHYVKTADGFKKINNFCLHFYGVKAEDPNQEVRIEQSQSDRTKKPFHPVPIELRREGAKVTVGRLHFAETTNNNMRKKGRPNPDQRHFQLVVALRAHTAHADYMIAAHASDRIIVRASNPGQFESDCGEGWWQRGAAENSVHYSGRVGINTDRPDEACVIHGNLKVMGHIVHPSDARAKHNIEELDTAQQLKNVQNIRVVKFKYDSMFAAHSGLVGWEARGGGAADTGVLAQELRAVLPDAVREAGDVTLPNGDTIPQFLVVNKDRIFMENLGAVKELCKVTGHLESRIDQLERINRRLCKRAVQRRDSQRSSGSEDSRFSGISNMSKSLYSDGNITIDQIRDIARSIRKQECCHKLSHNSPKFTRKQCKHCQGNSSKYGKYYNYNKTSAKCSNKSDKFETESNYPTYVSTLDSNIDKLPDENFSTISRKKNSCIWLRDDSLYGNSKLPFCCRKYKYDDPSGELISNKYLQIIITILIFVMAVCLVVMSALYFREHQQLVSLRESRTEKAPRAPPYKQRPTDLNRIQSLKSAQHLPLKKTAKEKGTHKTTPEYVTSTPDAYASMAALHATKNYVKSVLHMEASSPRPAAVVSASRRADVIGRCDALRSDNELDADCQSSCGLDTPQSYDSQEPFEANSDKEVNETRPPEPPKDKVPLTPVIPEKNNSDPELGPNALKLEKESFKLKEENLAESNYVIPNKNITESRLKREVRETNPEDIIVEQSEELSPQECEHVWVGAAHNCTLWGETVCAHARYNYTYALPLAPCLHATHLDIHFKTAKLKDVRLCELSCKFEAGCDRERAKPAPAGDAWAARVPVDCNTDRRMKIRASFTPLKELCLISHDSKTPFIEFNIHIYRDCRN
ncbi:uncharacterized protein LOC121726930 [Aricia agestis]|uniref:uncharacterized protein LOC121726930 n=1 Tax=Aricia agestis TaxID=91739 RepID=UPI001C2032AF|nr:uncharacterized protein LOC121726930 [Aricia agestis]